jgi:PhnB protein
VPRAVDIGQDSDVPGSQAGAASLREPADQFYGDRNAQLQDPSGHVWFISTHKEDGSPEELRRRFEALSKRHA